MVDFLGWLKDSSGSGSHLATQCWEPEEVAVGKGVRGLGREGPAL